MNDISEDEARLLEAWRAARRSAERPLPVLELEAFRDLLRARLGLGARTAAETLRKFTLATLRYDGPRVIVTGTLSDLRASWLAHHDDLVKRGLSGPVVRHRREAIARYCRVLDLEWVPEISVYEKRSRAARNARSEIGLELPGDWVERVAQIVNGVSYHADPALNEMYRHRARMAFNTGPRIPSEDSRLRLRDVDSLRGVVTYRQGKIAGPEGGAVLIPREVFGLSPSVLSWSRRRSLASWVDKWRPKLEARAELRHGGGASGDYVWLGIDGLPQHPEKYRQVFSAGAKTVWPGFYPYLTREIAIIVRALEIILDLGYLDLELLIQWSGHQKMDTLRRYTRKARGILREAGGKPEDLAALLYKWRQI